jgi:hypothetical protein
MNFNPKWIVGKTVDRIEMRPFKCGPGASQRTAHDPIIWFTDGSSISFVTEETEGDCGTEIVYWPSGRR